MKILVLGGAGFIGSNLTRALIKAGHCVRVFTRNSKSSGLLADIIDDIDFRFGDFQDEYALRRSIEGIDCVFHLVTSTFPNTSIHSGIYDVQTNLIPTIRLLEECQRQGVRQLVYLSSGGTVYGEPKNIPIVESDPLDPISVYGNSKKLVESYLDFFTQHSSLCINTLRVSNPFGPGQNPYGAQGLVAVACAHMLDGRPFPVIGDGSAVRDYLYIDDLVGAMMCTLSLKCSTKVNISSAVGRSVTEVLDTLECVSGRRVERIHLPDREDLVRSNILSNLKAREDMNWEPVTEFSDGLSKTWNWVNQTF